MCGVAGCVDQRVGADDLGELGRRMAHLLRHRGPDGSGTAVEPDVGLAIAHTRLAVLDPGPTGAQPMASADGRYVISYNGEIYNHLELRRQLAPSGVTFRGRSDTETLLAAIAAWGVHETLTRSHGMFAFAVYDRVERRLVLARDRFGQKPLYHGVTGGRLVFCSDLVALDAFGPRPPIDRAALAGYFRTGSVPGDRTIHRGLAKVRPGSIVEYRLCPDRAGNGPGRAGTAWSEPEERVYWSLADDATAATVEPFPGTFDDALDRLDELIGVAVRRRLLSDVPVGALLSGGVDSTLVVAAMQAAGTQPVKTYTVAFPGHGVDESSPAAAVARHLGTDHDTLAVTSGDLLDAVPTMASVNGEPFADPSLIPTHLICRHARRSVTVCLGGDGGDELFGGYPWHRTAPRVIGAVGSTPLGLRHLAAAGGRALSDRPGALGRRAGTLARVMSVIDARDARFALTGVWKAGSVPVLLDDAAIGDPVVESARSWPLLPEIEQQLMWFDSVGFLPDSILTKIDRASMAASLEARAPLLDHDVARFAWSLPTPWRIGPRRSLLSGGRRPGSKWILRKLLDRSVPPRLVDRPKQGFDLPIASWLRGELAEWAGDLLAPSRLRADGYLDVAAVTSTWDAHRRGESDHARRLWTVLMFQSWLARGPGGSEAWSPPLAASTVAAWDHSRG